MDVLYGGMQDVVVQRGMRRRATRGKRGVR